MDDFFTSIDVEQLLSSGGFLGGMYFAFRVVQRASRAAIGTLEGATKFDADRIDLLEEKVTKLERTASEQRRLKHDWRSFATSMYLERTTIRHSADLNGCVEVVSLMDRLDDMRRTNPLMTDLRTITEGDPDTGG